MWDRVGAEDSIDGWDVVDGRGCLSCIDIDGSQGRQLLKR